MDTRFKIKAATLTMECYMMKNLRIVWHKDPMQTSVHSAMTALLQSEAKQK